MHSTNLRVLPELMLERHESIAMLTLNNPERLNPITGAQPHSSRTMLAVVARNAAYAHWCSQEQAGPFVSALISPDRRAGNENGRSGQRASDAMHEVYNRVITDMRELPIPVVCAIMRTGPCIGGQHRHRRTVGVVLSALMAKLGIVPDVGFSWFYQGLLGTARATALTLLGRTSPPNRLCNCS